MAIRRRGGQNSGDHGQKQHRKQLWVCNVKVVHCQCNIRLLK
jgi:hypothetical protein